MNLTTKQKPAYKEPTTHARSIKKQQPRRQLCLAVCFPRFQNISFPSFGRTTSDHTAAPPSSSPSPSSLILLFPRSSSPSPSTMSRSSPSPPSASASSPAARSVLCLTVSPKDEQSVS